MCLLAVMTVKWQAGLLGEMTWLSLGRQQFTGGGANILWERFSHVIITPQMRVT